MDDGGIIWKQKLHQEAIVEIHLGDDGHLGPESDSGEGEKWQNVDNILMVEPV